MPLTSPSFLFFLCAIAALHWLAPSRARVGVLLAASYLWYGFADPYFLVLLLGTTAFDFQVAKALEGMGPGAPRRAWFLGASLAGNLAVLGFFKLSPTGAPLGVSFYTFHSVSYVVDVYHRRIRAERSLARYALYVAFFPKIVAGPIERFADFSRQLLAERRFVGDLLWRGGLRIIFGLFLKLVLGDSLALVAGGVFDRPLAPGGSALLGVYAYSAQIYADFLGYTLIARGAALLFGFELERNFTSPYFADSPRDFWRRWHRSLSFWFRDYVYIPLGGRRGNWVRNVVITMALAGLWHGAAPTYLAWGLYHAALLLAGEGVAGIAGPFFARTSPAAGRALGWFFTLQAVCFGWIFFRAPSLAAAGRIFTLALSDLRLDADRGAAKLCLALVVPWALVGLAERWRGFRAKGEGLAEQTVLAFGAGCCVVAILMLGDGNGTPFIYFRF